MNNTEDGRRLTPTCRGRITSLLQWSSQLCKVH